MLVISRRPRQTLELGSDISVTVLEIRPDQVRLGVEAPREVRVVRGELLERVRASNQLAARLDPSELRGQFTPGSLPMRVGLPVKDLRASVAFYQSLQFVSLPSAAGRCRLLKDHLELELWPGPPRLPFGMHLVSQPSQWILDPDGYRLGI